MSCGAETEANALIQSLLDGVKFAIPEIDLDSDFYKLPGGLDGPLYQTISRLTNEDLSSGEVGGTGTFDQLMKGIGAHLKLEYEQGRITGTEYTKAYIELTQAALSTATQFLLGKDQAFWAAITAQVAAINAQVQIELAKVQVAQMQFQAMNAQAEYALTKLKLSTESMNYCVQKFNLEEMLPIQKEGVAAQTEGTKFNTTQILPGQKALLDIQQQKGNYEFSWLMPQQLELLNEQVETARGSTVNTRRDGVTIAGSAGAQRLLLEQQVVSYKRDSEVKAAKLFTDAWITQKTIDEGLLPPDGFSNASIQTILVALKNNNNLN